MKILLTGANGFIGRYILASLSAAGHEVVAAVRISNGSNNLPLQNKIVRVDLNHDLDPAIWVPRLRGVDAVINCAGILQGGHGQSIESIHTLAPQALFEACMRAGVRRVIQISAISVGAATRYAWTKRAADEFLSSTPLDWVILRPSLVYAPGAYGGTALLRALAALPFAIPVVGTGEQQFQPIYVNDLCATVVGLLQSQTVNRVIIEPVGPERLTMREILTDLRRWLGLRRAPIVEIPLPLVRVIARLGDFLGGTINSTALHQLEFGNTGDPESFATTTGIQPQRWRNFLIACPAQVQDRWHARLYLLRPLLRVAVALTWIWSGVAGLVERHLLDGHFGAFGLTLSQPAIWATCIIDIAIGAAVLLRRSTSQLTLLQVAMVLGYTIALSIAQPSLWVEPLGPLLKNVPFIAGILILGAIEREK